MAKIFHIYYGDGKGKTTAAVGAAVRAACGDRKIFFAQFLKDGNSGELEGLRMLNVSVATTGTRGFVFNMNDDEKSQCQSSCQSLLTSAMGNDFIVLDEVLDAVACKMLTEEELLRFIMNNKSSEIIVTGHCRLESVFGVADYISLIKKEKHPYDMGVAARRGIEY